MKKSDIRLGMPVAYWGKSLVGSYSGRSRYDGINRDTVMGGRSAHQGFVVGIGHYRLQQQGLCGTYCAIDTPAAPPGVVLMVRDLAAENQARSSAALVEGRNSWRASDIKVPQEWRLDIISASTMIPWGLFETLRNDRQFILSEMEAIQTKISDKRGIITDVVRRNAGKFIKHVEFGVKVANYTSNETVLLFPQWGYGRTTLDNTLDPGSALFNLLSKKDQKLVADALAEINKLNEQLRCKR